MANQVQANNQNQMQDKGPSPILPNILKNVVGLNDEQLGKLTEQGINTVDDMILIGQQDILAVFKGPEKLTAMVKSKLKAFIEWIQYQEQIHGADKYDLKDFNNQACADWQRCVNNKRKSEDRSKATKKDALKLPETFNGKQQSWLKSKREMQAYLGQLEGVTGIPLIYVIDNFLTKMMQTTSLQHKGQK